VGGLTQAQAHVFGYGSLVADDVAGGAALARLPGFRRTFGVAMDNREEVPGYKAYREPGGSRPAVYVAFLDLESDPRSTVNGTLRPVSDAELDALDRRERNYDRIEVTDRIEPVDGAAGDAPERVFAYRGSTTGRERLEQGRAAGTAVIARAYLEHVRTGFAALGPVEERAFLDSTDVDGLPVLELERIEVPA
jgi:dephospho-CoA kinase